MRNFGVNNCNAAVFTLVLAAVCLLLSNAAGAQTGRTDSRVVRLKTMEEIAADYLADPQRYACDPGTTIRLGAGRSTPPGGGCVIGLSPFGFMVYGKNYRIGGQAYSVSTCCREFEGLDPVNDFSDRKLIGMWRQLVAAAEQGDAAAAASVNYIRGIGLYIAATHNGARIEHLREVPRPIDVEDETIQSLEDRTWLVEFVVPRSRMAAVLTYLGIPDPDAGAKKIKLRGWYIKGDGIGGHHPLAVIQTGLGGRVEDMYEYAFAYVAQGFDVLIYDKRNHGWSGGFTMFTGQDIISSIRQLQKGVRAYGPEDEMSAEPGKVKGLLGAPVNPELGKSYTAYTKPMVLFGHSMGALDCMRAMALNFSDYQIEAEYDQFGAYKKTAGEAAGYNIVGIVASSAIPGTHRYECNPFMALIGAMYMADLQGNSVANSNIYRSLNRWTGFLTIKPTQDYLSSPEGMIDIFNDRLSGRKGIVLLQGTHDIGHSEAYRSYFLRTMTEWAVEAVKGSDSVAVRNDRTSIRKELSRMAGHDELAEADKWWKRLKRNWLQEN